MNKFLIVTFAASFALLTACSGSSNVAACEAYVTTVNELPCYSSGALDPATSCPAALDDTGCDISAYYDCLSENSACMDVGGTSVPDNSGITTCVGMNTCG